MATGQPPFLPAAAPAAAPNGQLITPPHANPNMNAALNAFRLNMNAQNANNDNDSDDELDDSEDLSPIQITIHSPLIITGNNNLIASDSSATANSIAQGVVAALKQMSMGQHGIPMIDENGRPRPLLVNVEAECRVEGSSNIFGERAVLTKMLEMKSLKTAAVTVAHQVVANEGPSVAATATNGTGAPASITNGLGIMVENGTAAEGANNKRERSSSVGIDAEVDSKRSRRN